MNRVFEDFLSIALTEALRAHGVSVRLQHTGRHLDHERALPLRPDITVWRAGRGAGRKRLGRVNRGGLRAPCPELTPRARTHRARPAAPSPRTGTRHRR